MRHILIYQDEGVGPSSFQHLFKAFVDHLPSQYVIQAVNHSFFLTADWEKSTALIAFPGGRDFFFHQRLQGEANTRIREYVKRGGRFLGICAGGYYGSAHIEFEKGGELEICSSRELAFFPGKAVGPAYGNGFFRYESECGVRAAQISWEKGTSAVYYNGGCLFEGAEKYTTTEVIARYSDLPNTPAAAVYCTFGRGAALLSGVHPEFSADAPFLKYLLNKILI